jgi:hypothetical protein
MQRPHITLLLSGVVVLFGLAHAVGETLCKPAITFKQVRMSEIRELQRRWTAVLHVDASSCATTSGRFSITFIRIKEMTPDLLFTEQFTWRPGQIEVSVELWADEAVHDFSIGYTSLCACRS